MILGDIPLSPPSREIGRVCDVSASISDYIGHIASVMAETAPVPGHSSACCSTFQTARQRDRKKIFNPVTMYGWHADFIAYDPTALT